MAALFTTVKRARSKKRSTCSSSWPRAGSWPPWPITAQALAAGQRRALLDPVERALPRRGGRPRTPRRRSGRRWRSRATRPRRPSGHRVEAVGRARGARRRPVDSHWADGRLSKAIAPATVATDCAGGAGATACASRYVGPEMTLFRTRRARLAPEFSSGRPVGKPLVPDPEQPPQPPGIVGSGQPANKEQKPARPMPPSGRGGYCFCPPIEGVSGACGRPRQDAAAPRPGRAPVFRPRRSAPAGGSSRRHAAPAPSRASCAPRCARRRSGRVVAVLDPHRLVARVVADQPDLGAALGRGAAPTPIQPCSASAI